MFRRRQRERRKSNSAALHFFVHFFTVNARLRSKTDKFHVLWRRARQTRRTWIWLLGVQQQESSPMFDKEKELL